VSFSLHITILDAYLLTGARQKEAG